MSDSTTIILDQPNASPSILRGMVTRQELLLPSLINFFKNPAHMNILIPIVNQSAIISLRVMDWLVTNYVKKDNNIFLQNIYQEYKKQLDSYSKRQFDPFCRRERLRIEIANPEKLKKEVRDILGNKPLETTIGQLNFFRWAIGNGIVDYALKNLKDIEQDMIRSVQHRYEKEKETATGRRKRKELSKPLNRSVCRYNESTEINFS